MYTVNDLTKPQQDAALELANNRKVGRVGPATCFHLRCQKR